MAAIPIIAVALLLASTIMILVSLDWRVTIFFMGLQYVGVFLLVLQSWPLEMAIAKLVSGWMAAAILGATLSGLVFAPVETHGGPARGLFRFLAGLLVVMLAFSVAPEATQVVPQVTTEQAIGGLLMLGIGLLILGLTANPIRVIIGLLMFFGGFEIYYSSIETSVLIAGLLSVVNLALALISAYLAQAASVQGRKESD